MRWVYRAALAAACLSFGCGRPTQSTQCQAFITCVKAIDAMAGQVTNLDRFEASGVCWRNEETAEGCAAGCRSGLDRLRERTFGLPAECAP